MRSLYLVVVGLTIVCNISVNAQAISSSGGGSGLWNDPASWSPATVPTAANSTSVTINSGHTITVSDTRSIDQITVNGSLVINSGFTLTINDGTNIPIINADLALTAGGTITNNGTFALVFDPPPPPIFSATAIINGTFNNAGTITNPSPARLNFAAGSIYNHQHTATAGVVPSATWNATSTCQITGYTSNLSAPLGLNQTFGHFTWDTPLLENYINLNGALQSVTGNLTINNIPATYIALTESTNFNLVVGGNFTVSNSYVFFNTAATVSISVAGNTLFQNNNDLSMVFDGSTTIDANGSLTFDGGTNNLTYDGVGSLIFTVAGDYALINSPAIANAGSGTYTITYDGPTPQAFAATQELTGFSYIIQNGSQVNVGSGSAFIGAGGFTLQGGATLGIGSVNGLVTGTVQGAVRVSGTRTYTSGSNIVYNGSVAQNLGSEWSGTGALSGVSVNLEIDNSSGTGVTNNAIGGTSLVGRLRLTRGALNIGNSNMLIISGDFEGFSSPTRVGTVSGDVSGTSDLQFGGSGTISGTLNFTTGANTLRNFTIARNSNITLGTNLTIVSTGTLAFNGSGNLVIDGLTLTVDGNITQAGGGAISSSTNTSNIVIGGSGALTALPLCTGCLFNNVTLSRGSGTYTWNANATVAGMLDLATGAFTLSSGLNMGTGSTFRRGAGTTYTGSTPNAATRYSVSYVGTVTTSNELPTTALNRLENLTTAGDVTLDKDITINGDLNINSGRLTAGAHDINMLGAAFAINGGAFDINSGNTVTFGRAGTTTMSGSTINDAQFGNFTINTGTTVVAPAANIGVSGNWANAGVFTPSTGTVTFNGGAQDIDANGQSFFNLITSSGVKTLTNTLDVNGQLTILAGSTLAADTYTINIAGLWQNQGTFSAGTGTVLFDGAAQTINAAGQSFYDVAFGGSATKTLAAALDVNHSLTINPSVTLDVSVSNYAVNVALHFTNNGTLNPRAGTVFFDGSVIQTITGLTNTVFNNITTSNASTVSFATDQSLAGVLTLNTGSFNPNGHFIMLSTSTRDARIAPLGGTATISNTSMTVQRYLPNNAGTQVYRYLASPVTNGTIAGWKDDFPITGSFTDPSTSIEWPQFPNMSGTSLYRYNEAKTPSTIMDDRYEAYPLPGTTAAASPVTNGRGYSAYVRQNAPITIEQVGRPAFGPIPVTVTNQAGGGNDGWNLIGNPYPAPINWDNVTLPAGVSGQIAVKDNTNTIGLGAGQYVYYTQGSPGVGIPASYNGAIASGQGFWVRKTTAGPVDITFQEDDKQAINAPPVMREAVKDMLRINVATAEHADELLIRFLDDADDKAEDKYDAYKLKNSYINFSSLSSDGQEMAINTFGALTCAKEIPLHLTNTVAGGHRFTFSEIESFSQGIEIRLLDAFAAKTIVVREGATTYDFQVTADAASFGNDRFKLFIGYQTLDLALSVESTNVCSGQDATIKLTSPEAGVTYYASLNGTIISDEVLAINGEAINLNIPKASLGAENNVVVMAKIGNCTGVPLNNIASIEIGEFPAVSEVIGAMNCGEGSVTLKAAGTPADGEYRWYLTEDATDPIGGEHGSSFMTPLLSKTKTYFVSAVSSAGCESGRMAVTATISHTYDVVGVTGAQSCDGGSFSLAATGAPNDGSYKWYLSESSVEAIPNQSSATFVTPELSASATYYVAIVNGAGCEGARVPVTAEIGSVEPTITNEGDVLSSNYENGNQWYLNGTAIDGATGKNYTATKSGVYKLVVTLGNCSNQVEREFAVTGDIDSDARTYSVHPNATSGLIYIDVATTEQVFVTVKSQLGTEITSGDLNLAGESRKGQFDISGHAGGLYLVVINHGEKTVVRKIVKN